MYLLEDLESSHPFDELRKQGNNVFLDLSLSASRFFQVQLLLLKKNNLFRECMQKCTLGPK